jgi:hypothetical protein
MKTFSLFLLVIVISFCTANAQIQAGKSMLGFSISADNQVQSSGKFNATSYTDLSHTFSIGLSPQYGYFLSDNLLVGLGVSYNYYSYQTNSYYSDSTPTDGLRDRQHNVYIYPYVRYYNNIGGNFYCFLQGSFSFGYSFEVQEHLQSGSSHTTDKYDTYSLGIVPGLCYVISNKFLLETTIGGLGYYYKIQGNNKASDFNFNFDISGIGLGFKYIF